jgi:hypothetical protein
VAGIPNVNLVAVGGGHMGAMESDKTVWMWGDNMWGQLGDSTNFDHIQPEQLNAFGGGPVIHYTTNGSEPTDDDPVIDSGATVMVSANLSLKARAFRDGYVPSPVKSATYTINLNPIDDARTFVRQHYLDFLSREPDQAGWDYWTSQITQCGLDALCIHNKRVDVSNSFFYEQEFQQTGSYVYRLYRAAFGNNQPFPNTDSDPHYPAAERLKIPAYSVFGPDRAQVVGGASLAQGQLDFANVFVQRPAFVTKYPLSLDGPGFVTAVLATIKNDIGPDLSAQTSALLSLYNSGGRGAVLYRLADDNLQTNPIDNRAFIDAAYNRAFVTTQYFGYFRRDADIAGFLFWLDQVNSAPLRDTSKQHAMVCSQITSPEYQQRFSQVVTHGNGECGP